MIISELNNLLVTTAKSNYLVNEAYSGDVYDIDTKENRFGCFVATPMTALRSEGGTITYNYTIYYIDRLTQSEDNIDFVQSDAMYVLKGVLDSIEDAGVQLGDDYQFTLFRHQFSDWCAGAYVTIDLIVPDTDCGEFDFNVLVDLRSLYVTRNGTYSPEGFDGYNTVTVNVPQQGASEEWVDEEIDRKLEGYATEEWVQGQGYLTEHQHLKTINHMSLIGEGNIDLEGGGVTAEWVEERLVNAYETIGKLEDYFYAVEYNHLDYVYAKNHMSAPVVGGCSVIEFFNDYVITNYDWTYDRNASFVVKSKSAGLNEVIGVAGSVAGLDMATVDSGVFSELYKILPFYLHDGMNEHGLFCKVQVVPSLHNNPTVPLVEKKESISNVMLVRYILDHFSMVDEAVDYLRNYVEVYNSPVLEDMGYELHYYLSDGDDSVVVEIVDDTIFTMSSNKMTNFHLYGVTTNEDGSVYTPETANQGHYASENGIEDYGSGLERWNILNSSSVATFDGAEDVMKSMYYTTAYSDLGDNSWFSEFVGGDITVNTPSETSAFASRMTEYRNIFAGRTRDLPNTWQTVHSAIYDRGRMKLYAYCQEGEKGYEFGFDEAAAQEYVDNKIVEVRNEIIRVESEIPSLTGYATETWVQNQGYLTQSSLTGYATTSYVDSALSQASTLFENELALKANITWVQGQGYATQEWVEDQNYVVNKELENYATTSYVNNAISEVESEIPSLTGYATETWVQNQGYLTEHQDISGKVNRSEIWTGPLYEWEDLTPQQQASYLIALITE